MITMMTMVLALILRKFGLQLGVRHDVKAAHEAPAEERAPAGLTAPQTR